MKYEVEGYVEKRFSEMIQVSAKGSMILILGQMVSTLISALGTILVARMLGSVSFGVISIAQIPVNLALLFINNGIDSAVINYLAIYREEGRRDELRSVILAGFLTNFVIGLLVTLTLYGLSAYLADAVFKQNELETLIRILSVSVLATSILNTSMAVFVGFERMGRRSILSIIYSTLKSVIGPTLIVLGFGVVGVAWGLSVPLVLVSILGAVISYIYMRRLPSPSSASLIDHVRLIVRYAYPLFLGNTLAMGMNQLFTFILPLYVSVGVMGNYSAATTFSVLINFFMNPVNTATFPLLSKLKPEDSVFNFVFQNIIKYVSIIVFPIATYIIALSKQLVLVLYGATYDAAPLFLRIYMLNYYFIGLGATVTKNLLNSQKETKVNLTQTLLYLVVGVPAGFVLIPRYGVLGYLVTTLFIPKIGLFYTLAWIKKSYGITPDIAIFIKTLTASAIAGIAAYTLAYIIAYNPWVEIILCGVIFMALYVSSILFTGVIDARNLQDIYSLLEKYDWLKPVIDPFYSILYRLSRK